MSTTRFGRPPTAGTSVGEFLIRRLRHYGVNHLFGIPGDYVLGLYDMLAHSPIDVIGVTKEDGAGFAADAYARVNGIGACCITYCVGGLSVTNAIAGAYAEKSPVVVISGAPGLSERIRDPMLHHKVKEFDTQLKIFSAITEMAVAIEDPDTAFRNIDEAFATCIRSKRPVYIEIPRDMVEVIPRLRDRTGLQPTFSDSNSLHEAIAEITRLINEADNPVILAGVEIHRHGLQSLLRTLVDRTNIPIAVTLLGKSVMSELHPRYIGVYEGAMGRKEVSNLVEKSDCVLMLGTFMTDVNLGIFTAELDRSRCIQIRSDCVQVRHHRYLDIRFEDVIKALAAAEINPSNVDITRPQMPQLPEPSAAPLAVEQLFKRLNTLLRDDMAVICDVGLCLFGAIDLIIHRRTEFIAPAYYTSMGFAIPACVGVGKARPDLRMVVLVGDGAFQMTGMELSTVLNQNLNPIIIILNNRGYTTERTIKDGTYNNIREWNYHKVTDVLAGGQSWTVDTEQQFVDAWEQASANTTQLSILEIRLDPRDYCPALERLGQRLADKTE